MFNTIINREKDMRITETTQAFIEAVKIGDITEVLALRRQAFKNKEEINCNTEIHGFSLIAYAILRSDDDKNNENCSNYSQIFEELKDMGVKISARELLDVYTKYNCKDTYFIKKLVLWDKEVKITSKDLESAGTLPEELKDIELIGQEDTFTE
jgi:hypothetical protein